MRLMQGDCLELMKEIPDGSVDMVLADPPYNIGVETSVNGRKVRNAWDKVDGYDLHSRDTTLGYHYGNG